MSGCHQPNSLENDIKILWQAVEELRSRVVQIEETIFEDTDLQLDD